MLERLAEDNKFRFFVPNGKQEDFINNVGSGDVFIGIFSAANGVGKTALMANIAANFIWGGDYLNKWFDFPIFRKFPYPKRGRIASTKKNVEEVGAIQTEIKSWFPKGQYETKKLGKFYDSEYQVKNSNWVFDIMTYEQDVSEYESATLGFMIFDEPPPIAILNACIARMRMGGVILIFMTPLDTGGTIIEELTEKIFVEFEGKKLGRVHVTYADIEDNCKIHGVRGRLDHGHILQMLQFYDQDEREARAKGKPTHLIGRIYQEFEDKDPYVVNDILIPDNWTRINILDPHDAIPFALTWAAIDETGQILIYDEFPFEDIEKIKGTSLTFPQYARIIGEKEGRDHIFRRYIDPYFGNKRYANDGKTPIIEMADLGYEYENGDTAGIDTGHMKVREFLKYDKARPVSSINHPRIHILNRCRNHRRALLNYKRKLLKTGEVKDKIVIEETFKHFADNIRHLCQKYDDIVQDVRRQENVSDTDHMMGGGRGGW